MLCCHEHIANNWLTFKGCTIIQTKSVYNPFSVLLQLTWYSAERICFTYTVGSERKYTLKIQGARGKVYWTSTIGVIWATLLDMIMGRYQQKLKYILLCTYREQEEPKSVYITYMFFFWCKPGNYKFLKLTIVPFHIKIDVVNVCFEILLSFTLNMFHWCFSYISHSLLLFTIHNTTHSR